MTMVRIILVINITIPIWSRKYGAEGCPKGRRQLDKQFASHFSKKGE